VSLLRLSDEGVQAERAEKEIVDEVSLKVVLNGAPLLSLLCLNESLEELVLGFLFTEGIIHGREDVAFLTVNEHLFSAEVRLDPGVDVKALQGMRSMSSACGRGMTFLPPEREQELEPLPEGFRMDPARIWEWMREAGGRSELHNRLGGVHSVLLRHPQRSFFAEDIGRHNCVDKIAGRLVAEDRIELARRSALLTSGRVSSEIVVKAIRLGVPLIASRSAPTASAVRLAGDYGIALIGYVRGRNAVLYCGAERLL